MRSPLLGLLLVAGALHAQTPLGRFLPVAELPGMGRAVDTAVVAARRRAVLRAIGRGAALVPAAHERDLERDYIQDNDFRQSNTFFYLTGLETVDAWLLLVAAPTPDSSTTILFLPARTPARERWTGLRLGPDSVAARLSGIARVLPVDSLDDQMATARRSRGPVFVPLDGLTREEDRIDDLLFSGADVRNLHAIVDSLRMVKDADELARLRQAIAITVDGQIATMQVVRPGMWEYQIEAVMERAFRWNGADRLGFPSIIGSGPNSTTLHYDVNRRQAQAGELVVMDVGAEWGQYTADVTRTVPVSGTFTSRQKAIYDLVLATQRVAFDSTRPGVTIRDLNRIARAYMKDHSGALCGEKACDQYFIHGLSHHLGMDVHDVTVPGRAALEPGMVITLEPGIYIPEEHLGVRIEDDVLVTPGGAEWLSDRAPRATEAIERLMRSR